MLNYQRVVENKNFSTTLLLGRYIQQYIQHLNHLHSHSNLKIRSISAMNQLSQWMVESLRFGVWTPREWLVPEFSTMEYNVCTRNGNTISHKS